MVSRRTSSGTRARTASVACMAFREAADAADDEQARELAAHRAEVFARERYVMTNERRRARRRQIAERLRELDTREDTAEVSDLEQEEQHLGELTPILILRDARVWGSRGGSLAHLDGRRAFLGHRGNAESQE